MPKKNKKASRATTLNAVKALDKMLGGPLTFAANLRAIREGDELTLEAFAKKLGISRANLCDIETGRKGVSAERAMKWATSLGYSPTLFVKLALQDTLDRADIDLEVDLTAKKRRKAA